MDDSKEIKLMLKTAMKAHPDSFASFDITKNIQDQLQEMIDYEVDYTIGRVKPSFWTLLENLRRFMQIGIFRTTQGDFDGVKYYCTSMEQLWLAFVMKEKFNKVWSGKEWK